MIFKKNATRLTKNLIKKETFTCFQKKLVWYCISFRDISNIILFGFTVSWNVKKCNKVIGVTFVLFAHCCTQKYFKIIDENTPTKLHFSPNFISLCKWLILSRNTSVCQWWCTIWKQCNKKCTINKSTKKIKLEWLL